MSDVKTIPPLKRAQSIAAVLLCRLMGALPLPVSRVLGESFFLLALLVLPRLKKVGMANLDLAYGDTLTPSQKRGILRGAARNLGRVAAEFSWIPRVASSTPGELFHVAGLEHVDRTQGGVFVGAHLGNWEWLAPAASVCGIKSLIVVRGFDDPFLDRMVDAARRVPGVETVHKDAAMGTLVTAVKQGICAGILADQNPRENALPAPFFGVDTWATIGPVMLARRAKCPVYPVSMTRNDDGKYVLEFHPPLEMVHTDDTLADLVENTRRCQAALETLVRRNPGQWLWFHRRWRRRERLEREWAARLERRESAEKQGD